MLKNIGLFCKRALQKRPIFCKETYIFKHPTHRSHPIPCREESIGDTKNRRYTNCPGWGSWASTYVYLRPVDQLSEASSLLPHFECFLILNEEAERVRMSTSDQLSTPVKWHSMGWLWIVGSIELQISFAKEACKRDDILQKRPMILSILLTVATLYPEQGLRTDASR